MDLLDRPFPQAIEAERALLGGLLQQPDQLSTVGEAVQPDDFYRPEHGALLKLLLEMHGRGESIDLVTVSDRITREGQAQRFGGVAYVVELPEHVPSTANLPHYAEVIKDKSTLRELIRAARELAEQAYLQPEDVSQLVEQAAKDFTGLGRGGSRRSWRQISLIVDEELLRIEKLSERGGTTTGATTGFVDLDKKLAGLQPTDLLILAARPAMGKCLAAGSGILLSDGRVVPLEEVVARRRADLIRLDDDLRLRPGRASDFIDDGIKPRFEVRTRLGRRVRTTATHPFLTFRGWRPLAELKVGLRIAVPRRIPVFGDQGVGLQRARLLGYLVADGAPGESGNAGPELSRELTALVQELRAPRSSSCAHAPSPAELRGGADEALLRWLGGHGLAVAGPQRRVPEAIHTAPRPEIAAFLSRLFAIDGAASVSAPGRPRIVLTSSSEARARQVQHLLLRFGILSRVEALEGEGSGGPPTWRIGITHPDSVCAFAEEIGIQGRACAVERARRAAEQGPEDDSDTFPGEIWARIDAARGARPWAEIFEILGPDPVARGALSRAGLARIAAHLGDRGLQELAGGDVCWDEIVAIEAIGPGQVYDLTVDEVHNFVADDVCVHNTALALNIAQNVALIEEVPVGLFSLEMSRGQLVTRMLCCHGLVDAGRVRTGGLDTEDWERFLHASEHLRKANIHIDDTPGLSIGDVRTRARRLKAEHDNLSLIVIDYLQLMKGDDPRSPREQQISSISRGLKALAKDLECSVLALSQLNRGVESRQDKRPLVSDLRESGAIEQDADVIMFIYRDDYYNPESLDRGLAEVIIAKQRNGPTGTVKLAFQGQFTRFDNYLEDDLLL
ncbi:MAG TPA: replicative DNA helicase [Deltaproteobacteria bacterium]|nr:replicative DNA helicase [Deltaproteobacteria bacterium]